jgi:hypothetical protein
VPVFLSWGLRIVLNIRIPNLANLPNLTAISVRSILNKYGYYIAGVIAVIALLAAYVGTRQAAEPVSYAGNPELAFFVDENTGEEKVLPADEVPPLSGKDGKESVVMAVKFKSDTEKAAKTWYFIKYPAKVRDRVRGLPKDDIDRLTLLDKWRLVRAPEAGSPWVKVTAPEAERIVTVPESSAGHPRRPVYPSRM